MTYCAFTKTVTLVKWYLYYLIKSMDPTPEKKTDLFKGAKLTDHSEVHSILVQSHSVLITAKSFIVQEKKKKRTVGQNPFSYNNILFLTLANRRCYSLGFIKRKNLSFAWKLLEEMISTQRQNSEATTLMIPFM